MIYGRKEYMFRNAWVGGSTPLGGSEYLNCGAYNQNLLINQESK